MSFFLPPVVQIMPRRSTLFALLRSKCYCYIWHTFVDICLAGVCFMIMLNCKWSSLRARHFQLYACLCYVCVSAWALKRCYDIPLESLFMHSDQTVSGSSTVVHLWGFYEPNRSNDKNMREHRRTRKDMGTSGLVLKIRKWWPCYVAQ